MKLVRNGDALVLVMLAAAALATAVLAYLWMLAPDQPSRASKEATVDQSTVANRDPSPTLTTINRALRDVIEGQLGTVVPVFDDVDLYQKNGLVEVYDMVFDQRRSGPVSVRESIVTPNGSDAWWIWSPDGLPQSYPEYLRIELGARLERGTLTIGFLTKDRSAFLWKAALGANGATAPVAGGLSPKRREQMLAGTTSPLLASDGGNVLMGRLQDAAREALRQRNVSQFFVHLTGSGAAQSISFKSILFTTRSSFSLPRQVKIAGKLVPLPRNVGNLWATLRTATGQYARTSIASDGKFVFKDVPADSPISIGVEIDGRSYHADRGRWFRAYDASTQVTISTGADFTNPRNQPIDPKQIKLEYPSKPLSFPRYKPNAKISWPGSPGVQTFYRKIEPQRTPAEAPSQEFMGHSFTNRIGFVDRERFEGNRDGCLRIAHVGGSSSVAIQVKPFQKFTFLLEQELGFRTGKCVEVISAGRDNGDLGSVYPIIRDYLSKFEPQILLIEHMQLLALQLQPELLRRLHGWDHTYSPLAHFHEDDNKQLTFVLADKSWPLSASVPTRESLIPGLPLMLNVAMPWSEMPPAGRDAHERAGRILAYYAKQYPGVLIALHTGPDQARCAIARSCGREFTTASGSKMEAGVPHFMDNVNRSCRIAGISCLHPRIPPPDRRHQKLTFIDDGHFNVRGHQWIAKELADLLQPILERKFRWKG